MGGPQIIGTCFAAYNRVMLQSMLVLDVECLL